MDEEKIQRLHDTLSKLGKGKGLGTSSHYNFGGGVKNSLTNNNEVPMKEGKDGQMYRDDGLPVNALYSNFVKQGSYKKQDSALRYGDGRAIKRNFDDCTPDLVEREKGSDDDDEGSTKSAKKRKKEKKKALKKAEKLEAKKKVGSTSNEVLKMLVLMIDTISKNDELFNLQ